MSSERTSRSSRGEREHDDVDPSSGEDRGDVCATCNDEFTSDE